MTARTAVAAAPAAAPARARGAASTPKTGTVTQYEYGHCLPTDHYPDCTKKETP